MFSNNAHFAGYGCLKKRGISDIINLHEMYVKITRKYKIFQIITLAFLDRVFQKI